MDDRTRYPESYDATRHSTPTGHDAINLEYLFSAIMRRLRVFVLVCVAAIALGIAYVVTAVPLYTAYTDLLIDERRAINERDAAAIGGPGFDTQGVDSQVEILKSGRVGLAVVNALQLDKDPRHLASDDDLPIALIRSIMSSVRDALNGSPRDVLVESGDGSPAKRAAVRKVRDNLSVERIGRTHVLRVSYHSADRELAARVADGLAEAYLTDQLDAKYEATRRASSWLQERIEQLRQAAISSDLAVQKYRTEHNLLAPKGVLVTDQQLSELSSQLILARAESAKAEARYRRIRLILESGQTDAAVSEALGNPVINKLRTSYLEASKKEAEFSVQVGPNHVQTVRLRNEMKEYERLIFDELKRIAESYESDFQVARAREQNLTDNLSGAVGVSAGANVTLVALRQLERESETYRNLHQAFLQRYQEALQRESSPITEARVITKAATPTSASHPRVPLVLALSLLFGGLVGVGLGALFEFRDRAFRTGEQIRSELGLEYFGMLPRVRARRLRQRPAKFLQRMLSGDRKHDPQVAKLSTSLMRHVLDAPLSQFAETLRSAKVAIDLSLADRPKLIGVVSVLPGEGKSTTAMNLAELIAHQGANVLLIDGDMRNPGLTRSVAPRSKGGLVEALLNQTPPAELYVTEPESKLTVLPAGGTKRVTHTSELLSSPRMSQLLTTAQKAFDYVIIDLPPVGVVVDARAIAPMLDAFILVTEWGSTLRKAVRSALVAEPGIRQKCLGVILNKVDSDKLRRYESYGSIEYYSGKFAGYYRDGR